MPNTLHLVLHTKYIKTDTLVPRRCPWATERQKHWVVHLLRHQDPEPQQILNPCPWSLGSRLIKAILFFPSHISKTWCFFPSALLQFGQPVPQLTLPAFLPPPPLPAHPLLWVAPKPGVILVFSALCFSSTAGHGRLALLPAHFSSFNEYSGYGEATEHFLNHRQNLFSLNKHIQATAGTAEPVGLRALEHDSDLIKKSEQNFSRKDLLAAKMGEANITSQIPSVR